MVDTHKISTVTFDLFLTLADTGEMWEGFFSSELTSDPVGLNHRLLELSIEQIKDSAENNQFRSMREIYQRTFSTLYRESGLEADIDASIKRVFEAHRTAPLFEDVAGALDALRGHYRLLIASDADYEMVDGFDEQLGLEEILISEQLQAYKLNQDNSFFSQVMNRINAAPDTILHVGDTFADIQGPHRLGMVTCWINRNGAPWTIDAYQPDLIVHSLSEFADYLL